MNFYKCIAYTIALTTLCTLIVANVFVSGSLSTAGEDLKQYENEKAALIEEISVLNNAILETSSLTGLQVTADELGFNRPVEILSLSIPSEAVAMNQ